MRAAFRTTGLPVPSSSVFASSWPVDVHGHGPEAGAECRVNWAGFTFCTWYQKQRARRQVVPFSFVQRVGPASAVVAEEPAEDHRLAALVGDIGDKIADLDDGVGLGCKPAQQHGPVGADAVARPALGQTLLLAPNTPSTTVSPATSPLSIENGRFSKTTIFPSNAAPLAELFC